MRYALLLLIPVIVFAGVAAAQAILNFSTRTPEKWWGAPLFTAIVFPGAFAISASCFLIVFYVFGGPLP